MNISAVQSCSPQVTNIKSKESPPSSDFASVIEKTKAKSGNETEKAEKSPLYTQPLFKHNHGNFITFDDLKAEAADATSEFQKGFNILMQENNIDTSKPIELQSAMNGLLVVSNNHPDKEKIEKILEQNLDLVNAYHHAEGCNDILKKGQEASEFQRAYALDPQAAVAKYSYLFNKNMDDVFKMILTPSDNGNYTASFTTKPKLS